MKRHNPYPKRTARHVPAQEREQANERQRKRAINTGNTRWRRIRELVLSRQPLCPECEKAGRVEPATEVDHHDGNSHNNDLANLVGLCRRHHAIKTRREQGGTVKREVDVTGCPEGWT